MKLGRKKNYNTTELNVENAFERHFFHRDMMAHYLRWNFIGRYADHPTKNITVIDFGCGKGSLATVLYVNRWKPAKYIGLDYKPKHGAFGLTPNGKEIPWCEFEQTDLVKGNPKHKGDVIVSYEVLEHVGKNNVDAYLTNFRNSGNDDATYVLSTPCYDGIHEPKNHTYDSGDGRGEVIQELTREELIAAFDKNGFTIEDNFGTFATVKDYKDVVEKEYPGLYDRMRFWHQHIFSVIFAPLYPELSRNNIWILKKN